MRSKHLFYTTILLAGAFFVTSCAPKATPAPVEAETEVPAATAAPVSIASEECIACHTDKQRLIDTAAPVVDAEGESKGVG